MFWRKNKFKRRHVAPVQKNREYSNPFFPKPKQSYWSGERKYYLVSLFLIVLGSFYVVFLSGYLQIKNIQIEGNKYLSAEEIQHSISSVQNSKKLFFLPQNNYLFFDINEAQAKIVEDTQHRVVLESLEISKKFPSTVSINLKERIPSLVWVTQDKYYYIDLQGVITTETTPGNFDPDFPVINDKNDKPVQPQKQVVSEEMINFIFSIKENLPQKISLEAEEFNIPQIQCQERQSVRREVSLSQEYQEEVNQYTIDQDRKEIQEALANGEITIEESLELLKELETTNNNVNTNYNTNTNSGQVQEKIIYEDEYVPVDCDLVKLITEIHVQTSEGWEAYFEQSINLDQQLNNLFLVLKDKIGDNRAGLSYIDLRFPDRIYYK